MKTINMNLVTCTIAFLIFIVKIVTSEYTLVWFDDFNGDKLDHSKWWELLDCSGRGNNELQCYTNRSANIKVRNGSLELWAHPEDYQGREFTSGRVHAKGAGWLYGKFEARARLPAGKHLWPAIWMVPVKSTYGPWPASGEIDIMEARGQRTRSVEGTVHYGKSRENRGKVGSAQLEFPFDFSRDFHVFGFEWTNHSMTWSVDGKKFFSFDTRRTFMAPDPNEKDMKIQKDVYWRDGQPFDHPFKWILNVAVGGNYFNKKLYGSVSRQEAKKWPKPVMEVDWVKVWQDVPESGKKQADIAVTHENYVKPSIDLPLSDDPNSLTNQTVSRINETISNEITVTRPFDLQSSVTSTSRPPVTVEDIKSNHLNNEKTTESPDYVEYVYYYDYDDDNPLKNHNRNP